MSRWIEPMLECRFHTSSWAFDSNALANALIDSGILCCDSPISRTSAICSHRNSILRKSHLFGGSYRGFLGYRIQRGVARGFRVVAWVLRPFRATLSHVKSDGQIPCQFHPIFWSPAMILSSPIADNAELDLISNYFVSHSFRYAAWILGSRCFSLRRDSRMSCFVWVISHSNVNSLFIYFIFPFTLLSDLSFILLISP
jgi:hypothetical protein